MRKSSTQTIHRIFQRTVKTNPIQEAVLLVENTSGSFSHACGHGGKGADSPLLMASVTKLLATACVLRLHEQGKISFEDKLIRYFDPAVLDGLHRFKGHDYSYDLTVYDLLFQTSGLPDAYQETMHSLKNHLLEQDRFVSFADMVASTKGLKPHFAPRSKNRAYYANINFDLLGEIIAQVTGLPLAQAYEQLLFAPLGLEHTYLPTTGQEAIPPVYHKDQALYLPQFLRSSGASGGCISTAREMLVFLKAFFGGKLFSAGLLKKWPECRRLQFSMGPLYYGCGYMKIPLGGASMLFQGRGQLLGHSGSTGSFAFYHPLKDRYFVGDVNQMANPAIPIRLVIQLAILLE